MIKKLVFGFLSLFMILTKSYGEEVVIIGDSLTVGSQKYIKYFIPKAVIDAKVGRKFQEVMDIIKNLEINGNLKDIVVISLATNGEISLQELVYVVDYLSEKGKKVILVNTKVPRRWEDINNYNIYLAKALRPHIEVVDWKRISDYYCKTYQCFRSDGYHLTDVGSYIYSYVIYYYIKNIGVN
ncbi:MAG: acyltransferase [Hydrogenothermaceae bacterium]|nr:acyltransferase [Hydrogenothermaceae bacterium]